MAKKGLQIQSHDARDLEIANMAYDLGWQQCSEWQAAKVLPLYVSWMMLEKLGMMIDTYASMSASPQARGQLREALRGDEQSPSVAAELTARLTDFIEKWRALRNVANLRLENDLLGKISARVEGLQRFTSGEDDGEYLRQACSDRGGIITDLICMLGVSDFGGRPTGMNPARRWIGQRALELRQTKMRAPRIRIAQRIIRELEDDEKRLDPIRRQALELLRDHRAPSQLKEYVRAAERDYTKTLK